MTVLTCTHTGCTTTIESTDYHHVTGEGWVLGMGGDLCPEHAGGAA